MHSSVLVVRWRKEINILIPESNNPPCYWPFTPFHFDSSWLKLNQGCLQDTWIFVFLGFKSQLAAAARCVSDSAHHRHPSKRASHRVTPWALHFLHSTFILVLTAGVWANVPVNLLFKNLYLSETALGVKRTGEEEWCTDLGDRVVHRICVLLEKKQPLVT